MGRSKGWVLLPKTTVLALMDVCTLVSAVCSGPSTMCICHLGRVWSSIGPLTTAVWVHTLVCLPYSQALLAHLLSLMGYSAVVIGHRKPT